MPDNDRVPSDVPLSDEILAQVTGGTKAINPIQIPGGTPNTPTAPMAPKSNFLALQEATQME